MFGRIIALPCICFSVPERKLIVQHGFTSFPEFLDNGFVKSGWSLARKLQWFLRNLSRFKKRIKYVVAPDNLMELGIQLKREFPANWLYPLHTFTEVDEVLNHFEFIGFPHRIQWRDFTLQEYLSVVPFEKRWYLGFWREDKPEILLQFKGFDTTIPETYSGRFGKLWLGWNQSIKATNGLKIIDIFQKNVHTLKEKLEKLFQQKTLRVN